MSTQILRSLKNLFSCPLCYLSETTETRCSIKLVSDFDFGNVRLGLTGNPVNTEYSLVEKWFGLVLSAICC